MKLLMILLAVVQGLDVVIHGATGQLELLRVASNVVIVVWLALVVAGRFRRELMLPGVAAVSAYVFMNGYFLWVYGVTNGAQGGGWRVALLVLVGVTVVGAGWVVVRGARAGRSSSD